MHQFHSKNLHKISFSLFMFFLAAILLTACGKNSDSPTNPSAGAGTYNIEETQIAESGSATPKKGSRNNTPNCLIPTSDGMNTLGNDLVTIDISHTDQGYLMVSYQGTNEKVKLQLTGSDGVTYTYNLSSDFEAFPFTSGDGDYKIAVYENISGQQYAAVFEQNISVTLENEFLPYLYASQYVNFSQSSLTTKTAEELAFGADDDLTVVANVYNYIISNATYDYNKAASVQSGYIPVVDELLTTNTGICFDFASCMAAMLRSQGIPTRLEIGYAGEAYHAWISTYLDERGWVNGIIEFDGKSWKLMDPTFAANISEKDLKKFIGDGENYVTKYIY